VSQIFVRITRGRENKAEEHSTEENPTMENGNGQAKTCRTQD
jgi:hypothetical protein